MKSSKALSAGPYYMLTNFIGGQCGATETKIEQESGCLSECIAHNVAGNPRCSGSCRKAPHGFPASGLPVC